jgi:hypothetical protein
MNVAFATPATTSSCRNFTLQLLLHASFMLHVKINSNKVQAEFETFLAMHQKIHNRDIHNRL